MPPSDPLRLQILNRFETVLNAIETGDNYFYTPHKVSKHPISYELAKNGPLYMVLLAEEGGPIKFSGTNLYDGEFIVSVQGIVFDRSNLGQKLINATADIQRAINEDSKSGASGSLGALAHQVITKNFAEVGYFSADKDDFAVFEQKYQVTISGDFGEL